MQEKYYVMLGDVVSSREISDRIEFQKKLEKACDEANLKYSNDLLAPFKISKGTDEVAGVLLDISNIYEIVTLFFNWIYPHQIRFSLVYDYIDVSTDTRDASKMDGPAFHKASEDMNELKLIGTLFKLSICDIITDSAIESEVSLLLMIKTDWSHLQYNIVKEYKRIGKQKEVADKLKTSQAFISRTLHTLRWKELSHIEKNLNYILFRYQQKIKGRQKVDSSPISRDSSSGTQS